MIIDDFGIKDWALACSCGGGVVATIKYILQIITDIKSSIKDNKEEVNNKFVLTHSKIDKQSEKIHEVELSVAKIDAKTDILVSNFQELKTMLKK